MTSIGRPPPAGEILLTGAAGRVGSVLRPMLRARYAVRLTDVRDLPSAPCSDESFHQGDLRDVAFTSHLVRGVRAIVHLAGETRPEATWQDLMTNSLNVTTSLLQACSAHPVRSLVYASSVHATGGYNDPACWPVNAGWPVRPCCRYGAAKAAGEALVHGWGGETNGSHVVCLRLGLVTYPIRWRPEGSGWLAEEDLCAVVLAALDATADYGVYYGVSGSDRPRYQIDDAERDLGYRPAVHASVVGLTDQRPAYAPNCRLWRR